MGENANYRVATQKFGDGPKTVFAKIDQATETQNNTWRKKAMPLGKYASKTGVNILMINRKLQIQDFKGDKGEKQCKCKR